MRPHRHEYFQIQISLQGDTEQNVAGTVRPFRRGYLSFILPYRVHVIPHREGSRYVIINMSQQFLRPGLDVDPLDLEDVPLSRAPGTGAVFVPGIRRFFFCRRRVSPTSRRYLKSWRLKTRIAASAPSR